jgi:hypothetical protein
MGIPKIIKKLMPESWLYAIELKKQHKVMLGTLSVEEWERQGKPGAAPSIVKWSAMKEYAAKYKATHFIETGTFMGDTCFEMKDVFKQIDTIELDEKLAKRAIKRFAPYPSVHVWEGDSSVKIVEILRGLPKNTTALFWLDGHFSGTTTAKADLNTPVSAEVDAIFKHSKDHVILVDDARLFLNREEDYPPFEEFEKQIKMYNPNAIIEVKDDIIRITSH